MKLLYLCSRTKQIRKCIIDHGSVSVSPSGKTNTNKEGVKVGMSPVMLPWNGKCWYQFVIFDRYTNGQRNRDVHWMHGLTFSSSVRESTQKQRPSRAMESSVQILVSECRSPTRSRASSVEAGARWAWNSSWRHKHRRQVTLGDEAGATPPSSRDAAQQGERPRAGEDMPRLGCWS